MYIRIFKASEPSRGIRGRISHAVCRPSSPDKVNPFLLAGNEPEYIRCMPRGKWERAYRGNSRTGAEIATRQDKRRAGRDVEGEAGPAGQSYGASNPDFHPLPDAIDPSLRASAFSAVRAMSGDQPPRARSGAEVSGSRPGFPDRGYEVAKERSPSMQSGRGPRRRNDLRAFA